MPRPPAWALLSTDEAVEPATDEEAESRELPPLQVPVAETAPKTAGRSAVPRGLEAELPAALDATLPAAEPTAELKFEQVLEPIADTPLEDSAEAPRDVRNAFIAEKAHCA